MAVESAGAEKGRIKNVRSVGGGHHDNAGGDFEAVHFGQHLVERLLTLIVTTTESGAAFAADGIDFVDEDNCFAHLSGGVEEVAHTAGANANEHLHEV